MKFYKEKIVKEVRLRRKKEGLGITQLGKIFNIPSGTISRWTRDIPSLNKKLFKTLRLKETDLKRRYVNVIDKIYFSSNNSKFLASLLYWCEGSKYPSTNFVAFSNSDEKLVYAFLSLLRSGFNIDEKKLRIHLQIHTTHNKKIIIEHWSKLLKIPQSQFYKPTITKPTKSMKRLDYRGTCTIKYFDVKLLLAIIGLYESFVNKLIKWRRG